MIYNEIKLKITLSMVLKIIVVIYDFLIFEPFSFGG